VSVTSTVRWGDRVSLTHTWTWTAATYADPANTDLSAPRDLHSLDLAITPVRGLPTLRAEVLNLFDVRGMLVDRNPYDTAYDPVVRAITDFSGFPLPGRTVMVSVGWQDQPKD